MKAIKEKNTMKKQIHWKQIDMISSYMYPNHNFWVPWCFNRSFYLCNHLINLIRKVCEWSFWRNIYSVFSVLWTSNTNWNEKYDDANNHQINGKQRQEQESGQETWTQLWRFIAQKEFYPTWHFWSHCKCRINKLCLEPHQTHQWTKEKILSCCW